MDDPFPLATAEPPGHCTRRRPQVHGWLTMTIHTIVNIDAADKCDRPVQGRFDCREIGVAVLQETDLIVWNHADHSGLFPFFSFPVADARTLDETGNPSIDSFTCASCFSQFILRLSFIITASKHNVCLPICFSSFL